MSAKDYLSTEMSEDVDDKFASMSDETAKWKARKDKEKSEKEKLAKEEIEQVDEAMKPAKRFVYDKPPLSIVNSYADLSTENLQGMHNRWRKDHESSSRVDNNVSDKLLAAHHVLKKRGVDVPDLPKHKNLGMSRTVSEDSRRVPMMKSDANFGLPRSVIEAVKTVMNENTEVDTVSETNDKDVDESKKKNLAALAYPKDKITKKDVLVGRGVLAKEEKEDDDKEPFEGPYKKVDPTKFPSRSHLKSMTKKSREDAEKTTKEEVKQVDEAFVVYHKKSKKIISKHVNHATAKKYAEKRGDDFAVASHEYWQDKIKPMKEEVELSADELARLESIAKKFD
jgi:hypothetical protein